MRRQLLLVAAGVVLATTLSACGMMTEYRSLRAVVQEGVETAIDDRKLLEVLRSDDREALVVAADRLVELRPELDELISAVLWKRAPAGELLPLLTPHLSREEALESIRWLVEAARA